MEITKGSDLILILQLEDIKGKKMRVSETAHFKLYVWTANRNNYLVFNKRDINTCGNEDKIAIPDNYMNCLESGVICYTYDYSKWDAHFKHTDCTYDKVKEVITELYWRNSNFNEIPANPVNYQTLEYLKDEIEKVRLENEREIGKISNYVTKEYTNKLADEIKRSNEVDIELHKLIKTNKESGDVADKKIEDKLNDEIKRSNEVDVEIFNLIKANKNDTTDKIDTLTDNINTALTNEISRATIKENEIATNLQTEVNRVNSEITNLTNSIENESSRAKGIEKQTKTLLDAEIDRAVEKENALNDKIKEEVARAKNMENELLQHLGDEIERSLEKDREHKQEIDIEVNRAKAEENRIETLLNNEVNRSTTKDNELTLSLQSEIERAKTVEADITNSLKNLKASVADKNTEVSDAIEAEVTRASAKENELKNSIDTVNTTVTNEVSRATAKEKEIADSVSSLSTTVADEVKRSTDKDAELTKAVSDEVARATSKENEVSVAVTAEISRAKAEEARIESKADTNASNLTSEIARAKAVEADITTNLTALKNKVLTDADTNAATYATKAEVDSRIKDVIGTAPEALDTLGEIANVLNGNGDAIDAINSILVGKANSADVYTKSEVDTKVATINSDIATEVARAKSAESVIADSINSLGTSVTDEVNRAKQSEKNLSDSLSSVNDALTTETVRATAKETELNAAITGEIARATAAENKIATDLTTESDRAKTAEKALSDKIDIINGDEIGSIAHSLEDAKHYTDGQIGKLNISIPTKVSELENDVPYLIEHQSLDNYYTKEEVDTAISNVDVTEQLAGYVVKRTGYDLSKNDFTDELKTKLEETPNFVVVESREELDNITVKDDNTFYYVAGESESYLTKESADKLYQPKGDYLTEHQDISNLASKQEVADAVAGVDVSAQLSDYLTKTEAEDTYITPSGLDQVLYDQAGNEGTTFGSVVSDVNDLKDSVRNTYTKTEIDTLGNQLKAIAEARLPIDSFNTWSATVATKEELAGKANIGDSYTKDESDAKYLTTHQDISGKVDKVEGKGLSTNDYTTTDKTKLDATPTFWTGTQAEYDAIATKDDNTFYYIIEG